MTTATQIVHWPGEDTPCCDSHAAKLKGLGAMLFGPVSSTACSEEILCTNCVNEAKLEHPNG